MPAGTRRGRHAGQPGSARHALLLRDGKPSIPDVKPAIRFKVPLGGTTKFFDAVFAKREFSNDEIEDFVLLRSGKGEEDLASPCTNLAWWSMTSTCASRT